MSIINPLSKHEIRAEFTHRGWFAFCPVYMAEDGVDGMRVCERNGIPAWWFRLAEIFMLVTIALLSVLIADYEPRFGFIQTGKIT